MIVNNMKFIIDDVEYTLINQLSNSDVFFRVGDIFYSLESNLPDKTLRYINDVFFEARICKDHYLSGFFSKIIFWHPIDSKNFNRKDFLDRIFNRFI